MLLGAERPVLFCHRITAFHHLQPVPRCLHGSLRLRLTLGAPSVLYVQEIRAVALTVWSHVYARHRC